MQKEIRIGKKIVSFNDPTFIVAELSANHKQDIELAKDTIYAIKESGADAVKLQTYTPDTITIDCKNQLFQISGGTLWDGKTLYELYQEAYTPWEWHYELKELAEKLGLVFFSTPFDKTAVDFLERLDVPAYKIASYEITDIPLIEYAASKGKPILISTGVATLCDIQEAVEACKRVGNDQIILLKCVSAYPTPLEDVNLRTIPNMIETFGCIVGLSDHTLGISIPIAAVTLGAKVIEKHFILSRDLDTPDKAFSLTPNEFKEMVKAIREVEIALGKASYKLSDSMKEARKYARSLFAVKDIKAGEVFTEENVKSVRPAGGLHPRFLKEIIGRKAKVNIKKGTPINWNMID